MQEASQTVDADVTLEMIGWLLTGNTRGENGFEQSVKNKISRDKAAMVGPMCNREVRSWREALLAKNDRNGACRWYRFRVGAGSYRASGTQLG
jgi:hypothetical protein